MEQASVNIENIKNFKRNVDHYLRDNRGFKSLMITLSSLEPFAVSGMFTATIIGKLGKLGKQCPTVKCFPEPTQHGSRATSKESKFASLCETETFHGACATDEVIVITHARYGRMRVSRCVKLDYGHIGCVADVIEMADVRCSGRRRCEIRIPDTELAKYKPCPDDLKPYLEIGYTCIKGSLPYFSYDKDVIDNMFKI